MDLVDGVYALTAGFPKAEEYRLTSQLLRAIVSVPANIAEGQRRSTRKDYSHFVGIAHGSLAEAETLLLVAERNKLAAADNIRPLVDHAEEISRMLYAMRQKLAART
jgi:four helix bundle protein